MACIVHHACLWACCLLILGCQPDTVGNGPLPSPNLDGPQVSEISLRTPPAANPATPSPARPAQAPAGPAVPADWIPPIPANDWKWIIIHHSATPTGSAAIFDREHRAKGWDELGYHFVIGNGTGSRDGQVEVGSRWAKQKWGAHAKTADNRYNDYGIGICLVGNFEIDRPSPAQLKSLTQLVAWLMQTYHIPADNVLGHGQTKATDCPGRNLSIATVRSAAEHLAAQTTPALPATSRTGSLAGADLLRPGR